TIPDPRAERARPARRRRRRVLKRAVPLLIVAVLMAALSAFGSTNARAADARTLSVTPATELGNQVVLVSWTGFTPTVGFNNTVTILQCKANPQVIDADRNAATADDCYTARPPTGNAVNGTATTQSDGTGSAFIELLPAAQLPMLDCSATNPCSLV